MNKLQSIIGTYVPVEEIQHPNGYHAGLQALIDAIEEYYRERFEYAVGTDDPSHLRDSGILSPSRTRNKLRAEQRNRYQERSIS